MSNIIYKATIELTQGQLERASAVLNGSRLTGEYGILIPFTASFANGMIASIEVLAPPDENPYVRGVLFDSDDATHLTTEPNDKLLGEWKMELDDNIYIVNVIEANRNDSLKQSECPHKVY